MENHTSSFRWNGLRDSVTGPPSFPDMPIKLTWGDAGWTVTMSCVWFTGVLRCRVSNSAHRVILPVQYWFDEIWTTSIIHKRWPPCTRSSVPNIFPAGWPLTERWIQSISAKDDCIASRLGVVYIISTQRISSKGSWKGAEHSQDYTRNVECTEFDVLWCGSGGGVRTLTE